MGKPRRNMQATVDETATPPSTTTSTQFIARVLKATGNNLYACILPDNREVLAELPARFRNTIWIKRGGYVLVDLKDADVRENKIDGEIVNVVRDERMWRREAYWPKEFVKMSAYAGDLDDEDSTIGKMPPSDDSE